MKRVIKLNDKKIRQKIADTFKVELSTVSMALNFRRNSNQSVAIRAMAMENGGVLYEESTNQKNIK